MNAPAEMHAREPGRHNRQSQDEGEEPQGRLTSFDGLRGLAAIVVVLTHCALIDPGFADPYQGLRAHGWIQVLDYTPAHLVFAGGQAVLVFFVLSGFVLARPHEHQGRGWRVYYPRRLTRLYVPAVAALALAYPQALVLRRSLNGASWWYDTHLHRAGLGHVLHSALLVRGTDGINPVLWSLQWEVIFSLLLPAYLLLRRLRTGLQGTLGTASLFGLVLLSTFVGSSSLRYLPLFGTGVLMAAHQRRLSRWATTRNVPLLLAAAALFCLGWWSQRSRPGGLLHIVPLAESVAAALVVMAFLAGPVAQWSERTLWLQWAGKRSFAIYLVHEPIVVSIASILGGHPPIWLMVTLGLPLSLAAGEVFGRTVEQPAQQMARRLGARKTSAAGVPARHFPDNCRPSATAMVQEP